VKPFGVAKARLAPVLDTTTRSRIGVAIAARTAALVADAAGDVVIVTGDPGVARWAEALGHDIVDERTAEGHGLDRAARAVAAYATRLGRPWAIVHADLPLVSLADLTAVFEAGLHHGAVAPSYDGGTNVLAHRGDDIQFAYGPGSFHRHVSAAPGAAVVVRPGLALDLDTPEDLAHITRLPQGAWLADLLGASR